MHLSLTGKNRLPQLEIPLQNLNSDTRKSNLMKPLYLTMRWLINFWKQVIDKHEMKNLLRQWSQNYNMMQLKQNKLR